MQVKKKEWILSGFIVLSVILLGITGTYAYFVASVGGTGNKKNNTMNVTSISLGSIKYEGQTVFTGEGYPEKNLFKHLQSNLIVRKELEHTKLI